MARRPRNFKRSPRSTHTKATVMFDYLTTAASAAAAYPNPPSNARCAASNCTELPGRMADFERKSAIERETQPLGGYSTKSPFGDPLNQNKCNRHRADLSRYNAVRLRPIRVDGGLTTITVGANGNAGHGPDCQWRTGGTRDQKDQELPIPTDACPNSWSSWAGPVG